MIRISRPLVLTLGLTWLLVAATAVRADFEADLRHALDVHERASSLEEQTVALDMFQEITKRYPDRWLGHFWTSYEETQIAMLHRRSGEPADLGAYLERAQEHLSKAERLNSSASERERSSVAALQSLIYRFRRWEDEAASDAWMARSEEAVQRAAEIDPDNPVVLVMLGTELVSRGQSEGDRSLLLAARHLLRLAQSESEKVEDRSRTTYFNSEWIRFWLPGAEQALAELNQ